MGLGLLLVRAIIAIAGPKKCSLSTRHAPHFAVRPLEAVRLSEFGGRWWQHEEQRDPMMMATKDVGKRRKTRRGKSLEEAGGAPEERVTDECIVCLKKRSCGEAKGIIFYRRCHYYLASYLGRFDSIHSYCPLED